jgi:hypothetical protein
MRCPDMAALLTKYQEATAAHSSLVTDLHQRMGTLPRIEFDALYQKTEQARQAARAAMQALDDHRADHGC